MISLEKQCFETISESHPTSKKVQCKKKYPQMERVLLNLRRQLLTLAPPVCPQPACGGGGTPRTFSFCSTLGSGWAVGPTPQTHSAQTFARGRGQEVGSRKSQGLAVPGGDWRERTGCPHWAVPGNSRPANLNGFQSSHASILKAALRENSSIKAGQLFRGRRSVAGAAPLCTLG